MAWDSDLIQSARHAPSFQALVAIVWKGILARLAPERSKSALQFQESWRRTDPNLYLRIFYSASAAAFEYNHGGGTGAYGYVHGAVRQACEEWQQTFFNTDPFPYVVYAIRGWARTEIMALTGMYPAVLWPNDRGTYDGQYCTVSMLKPDGRIVLRPERSQHKDEIVLEPADAAERFIPAAA